jgi:transcriptional regulator with XRE-family HTH domain
MVAASFRSYLEEELARRAGRNPRYSLRAFARHLGVDHSTLSQWLRGRRTISSRAIERLGARLRLPRWQVRVFSVREAHERAVALGASSLVAPQTLPEGDELAILCDPSGLPFGLLRRAAAPEALPEP